MSEFDQKDEVEPEDSIGRRRGYNDEQSDEVEGHVDAIGRRRGFSDEQSEDSDEDDSMGRRRR